MDSAKHRSLIESFIDAYNAFDIDRMVALMHPECRFRNVTAGEVNASADGIAAFRALAEQSRGLFASRRQNITGYREEADSVTIDVDFEGVLQVDVPGGPKTGEMLRVQGQSAYAIRDGLIYRLTDYS